MQKIIIVTIVVLCNICYAQNFNSITLKKSYSSKEELLAANPHLLKQSISIDKQSILVGDAGKIDTKKIFRSNLANGLNTFIFSPDRNYFVAFEETETASKELFFYSSEGLLLAKQTVNIYPIVKFTSNGEYVIAFNNFGREILVFTKTGLRIFSDDYINLISDKTKALENVFVSENATQILINAGQNIYLIDSKTKKQLFVTGPALVLDGNFYSTIGKLTLKKITNVNNNYDVEILSLKDGRLLDRVSNVSQVDFTPISLIVSKDSKINEYVFK